MNLRQIEAFKAVIESGTVSRAADLLHVSQPAASKLVARFEEAAGFEVFARERGRLVPTPEALMLYDEVERIFVGADEIARAARGIRELKRGKLSVGVPMALAGGFIQGVIARFLAGREEVSVSLEARSSPRLIELAAARRIDIGVVALMSDYAGVEVEPLRRLEGVCVLPAGHRLAEREAVTPEDLAGEPFVSLSALDRSRPRIDLVFDQAGVRRDLRIDTPMGFAACAFVARGAGVSIVDPLSAEHYRSAGIVIRPFRPPVHFDLHLCYPADPRRSQLVVELIRIMRAELERY